MARITGEGKIDSLGARSSAPRRDALSSVNLSANKRDGPLMDRGSIRCLDTSKDGFAGLVSCARAPAMALEEICRRGQRAGRRVEISAGASRELTAQVCNAFQSGSPRTLPVHGFRRARKACSRNAAARRYVPPPHREHDHHRICRAFGCPSFDTESSVLPADVHFPGQGSRPPARVTPRPSSRTRAPAGRDRDRRCAASADSGLRRSAYGPPDLRRRAGSGRFRI
jgi:hypothetical protein